jgi:zinc transporter, ZIP family
LGAAFGWGTVAASSLVIGAIIALLFKIGLRTIGLIMAFGAGVLISAVAFDLIAEAFEMSSGTGWSIAGLFAGCAVFFGGDTLIDRLGGANGRMPMAARKAVPRSRSCSARCSTASRSRW